MVTCTGHIGIHEGADGRTYVVRTDVDDVIAIKPNFLTSMGNLVPRVLGLFGQRVNARRDSGIIDSIFPENVGSGLMTYG